MIQKPIPILKALFFFKELGSWVQGLWVSDVLVFGFSCWSGFGASSYFLYPPLQQAGPRTIKLFNFGI